MRNATARRHPVHLTRLDHLLHPQAVAVRDLADPDDLDGDGISGAVVMGTYADDNIHPGRFGWTTIRLDRVDPDELRELVVEAWRRTAPKRAVAAFDKA